MLYLVETYWAWMVVAMMLGGGVGWSISPARRRQDSTDRWLWWAAVVFIAGLVVAILHWLPGRAGFYLETLLLLSFAYLVGYLLIRLARAMLAHDQTVARTAADAAGLAVASAPLERVRSTAVEATSDAEAAAKARRAADAKAAEEAKRAADAKAAEEAKRAADAKVAEEAKRAADAKAAEEAKRAADAKAAEAEKRAADAKAAEEAKRAADAKAAEEAKRAADAKAAEEAKRAAPAAAAHPGTKPLGLAAAHDGQADDLTRIKGIGPRNEQICNDLGVFHFFQIADWTPEEAIWVGHHIAFPGRIEREHWIAQARLLAAGGDTEHSAGVRAGTITVDEKADAPLDAATAAALGDGLPRQAPPVEGESDHPGRRPYGFAAPLGGQPDDLKRIKGIGPKNEERLHALGIWRFAQIAAWTPDNVKWVGHYLAFPGRIDRERWIVQAKGLMRSD
ncbi:MAG TPA: cell envelope biogenesis protein TolA [Xanthobacteraceae bacterium]|nr:cell envelope biogenesis protein TolA [Xanthobacteraceae bacterium]